MAEIKYTSIEPGILPITIEQRIKAGEDFTGEAPSLAGEVFEPYGSDVDGVFRMKQHDDPAKVEGDKGGLFTFDCKQPFMLEQVALDVGSSITWTLSVITTAGLVQLNGATSKSFFRIPHDRVLLQPGDTIKIVSTSGTVAMWARVSVRLAQQAG